MDWEVFQLPVTSGKLPLPALVEALRWRVEPLLLADIITRPHPRPALALALPVELEPAINRAPGDKCR